MANLEVGDIISVPKSRRVPPGDYVIYHSQPEEYGIRYYLENLQNSKIRIDLFESNSDPISSIDRLTAIGKAKRSWNIEESVGSFISISYLETALKELTVKNNWIIELEFGRIIHVSILDKETRKLLATIGMSNLSPLIEALKMDLKKSPWKYLGDTDNE